MALEIEVITPERRILKEVADSVVVPAAEGYLGVLTGHAPLITTLQIGVLRYRKDGEVRRMAVHGGFMEVFDDRVTVLADVAERAEEIDVDRALRARDRAKKRLTERPPGLDVLRAELALKRALTRLKAAGVRT